MCCLSLKASLNLLVHLTSCHNFPTGFLLLTLILFMVLGAITPLFMFHYYFYYLCLTPPWSFPKGICLQWENFKQEGWLTEQFSLSQIMPYMQISPFVKHVANVIFSEISTHSILDVIKRRTLEVAEIQNIGVSHCSSSGFPSDLLPCFWVWSKALSA